VSDSTKTRPFKVGITLPPFRPWRELRPLVETIEAVGLDSIWMVDHLTLRFPTQTIPTAECWSIVSALAAATRRVELGTLVSCTGYRNPAVLAKIAVTVDEISNGRLIVGLGAGWHEPEYLAFGLPFDHRAGRFDEAFAIIRGLLREGRVDVAGQYYQAPDCVLSPRSDRPSGPPIMVAASGKRMLRLTAQYADWWNGCWYGSPADVAGPRAAVDAACQVVGRDPATLRRTAGVRLDLPDHTGGFAPGRKPPITESPAAIAELLRGFAAEGIAHVQFWPDPLSQSSLERIGRALELI
jgi:alkanesulfonate monooxygenase SsuD/methylene tetrahydromethanopterin reductase-like flavin-dependent oxidoreductase (luciferase family)